MITIQGRAAEAADWFEGGERPDGSTFRRLKDGTPEWVREIVRYAHGTDLPDDWRYNTIEDALLAISNTDDPDTEACHEFADGADIYNADLLAWVGSNTARPSYVDEAREQFGEPRDFFHGIQMGQYVERAEVYGWVLEGLSDDPGALEDWDDD